MPVSVLAEDNKEMEGNSWLCIDLLTWSKVIVGFIYLRLGSVGGKDLQTLCISLKRSDG